MQLKPSILVMGLIVAMGCDREPQGDESGSAAEWAVQDKVARPEAPFLFTYHVFDDEVFAIMAEPGCYQIRADAAPCRNCATPIAIITQPSCRETTTIVRLPLPPGHAR